MGRGSVNGIGQGLHGDLTTTGAVCISSLPNAAQGGRSVLRLGDKTTPCPQCGKIGVIVDSLPAMRWMGIATVLDGAGIHCGCPTGRNRLIAPIEQVSRTSPDASRSTMVAPAPHFAADTPKPGGPIQESPPEEEEEEEELEQSGIVLRLGLFFDGTGNNQSNSVIGEGCRASDLGLDAEATAAIRQRCTAYGYDSSGAIPDNSYGNTTSNVARLHDLYRDEADVQLPAEAEEAHIKVYLEGIGTSSGQDDSIYSQGTGQGDTGVVARVEQAPALVLKRLDAFRDANPKVKVRRIEVDLFGFSRGAAAARHCANDLLKGPTSLLARALPAGSSLLTADFTWRHGSDVVLNFIGLFDTVAGIVAPLSNDFSAHNALSPGVNLRLAPGIARQVVQLVAEDEHRYNFPLTRTDNDLLMPGCHSDIGGGYWPLTTEKLLLSKPDSSFSPLREPNERSEAYRRTQQRFERTQGYWQTYIPREGLGVVTWDVETQPRARDTQAQKRVYAAIGGQRQVRGELSLVYLRIMRELGVRAGVGFKVIEDRDPALALPAELQPIAAKLQAYALREPFTRLNAEDLALLRRHYIHLSAHWNAAKGLNNSDLDVVFINRPAEGHQRAKYHQ